MHTPKQIRNVAVIAHIDHGKTTLLDCLLKEGLKSTLRGDLPERAMDSNAQEQERGITIFSKLTSIEYEEYKINIIDTPGHADFSGEVERVLGMVDGVLLLVDAAEGPMPQTRFVLSKSLKMGLHPIVIINKVDRPQANPDRALDLTFDLFAELGATDAQLDFAHAYASALKGYAMKDIGDEEKDMRPLLDVIIEHVPAPKAEPDHPFAMQVATISYDSYVGRQACGRIVAGSISKNDRVEWRHDGKVTSGSIVKVEVPHGLARNEVQTATAGDIAILSGFPEVNVGHSIAHPDNHDELPPIHVDDPTLTVTVSQATSRFAGPESEHVTLNKLRERFEREVLSNISLKITESDANSITVAGRGELHLAVVFESMRREGYAFRLSRPHIITKEIKGGLCEPIERAYVEVPEEYSGTVIEELSRRRGELQKMHVNNAGICELEFAIPTRGLMGYRSEFLTATRGLGVLSSIVDEWKSWRGEVPGRTRGSLIATSAGKTTPYALSQLEDRGTFFIPPGESVEENQVVGVHARTNDLTVNVTKEKKLTNVRASGTDDNVMLAPHKKMSLELSMEFIEEDEQVEVTPKSLRLFKRKKK